MYAVGGFDFPASTGNHSVTGLGFQPVGVIMFGSNFSTVGSLVTGQTGPGLFISVNALDYSDGTTIRSLCLALNGNSNANNANYRGYENGCISMPTNASTATVVDYRASTITFDSDGVTINVTTAAGSRRPIHYLAFGGDIGPSEATALVSSAVKQVMTGSPTFNNSYEPRSAIVVGTIAANGFGEGAVDGSCWWTFGSGHYPTADPNDWHSSMAYTNIQLSSPVGRQGFTHERVSSTSSSDPNAISIAETIGSLGPVLNEGFRRHRPNIGVDTTQMINEGTEGSSLWHYALWWNGEGWTDFAFVPDANTVTVNHPVNFTEFDAVLFSHTNGSDSSGNATQQRFGFGVLGPTYQGCVVFGPDGSCYQNVGDRCVAECTSSGIDTASGVLNETNFQLTAEEGGDVGQVIWHGFGHQALPSYWIPHLYRIVNAAARRPLLRVAVTSSTSGAGTTGGVGSGTSAIFIGYLVLEDGTSRIQLEDGSGFLEL